MFSLLNSFFTILIVPWNIFLWVCLIACNGRRKFFTSGVVRNYNLWSCQKGCETLTFLLDNIYVRFGSKLYRQIEGIPMDTNYAHLVADLFLFCYERDFMLSFSDDNQS